MAERKRGLIINRLNTYDKVMECEPDKSICIRAVIIGGFASGKTVVRNISRCDDVMSAIDCMRRLGAKITLDGNTAYIVGIGGKPRGEAFELFCGNSGTTAKLVLGLVSGSDGRFILRGDESLSARNFGGVRATLARLGAKTDGDFLPITVNGGPLCGARIIPREMSAQEKSAAILAGISASGVTSVCERERTRDHTENLLKLAGADISVDGNTVTVRKSALDGFDITVPGDISAAAYPLCIALAVKGGRCVIKNVGINDTRRDFLDILAASGARITVKKLRGGYEPVGEITAEYTAGLKPLYSDGGQTARAIDEIPTLCALACFIDGTSVFRGAGKLRGKETDRIEATCGTLNALGGRVKAIGDDLIVEGGAPLRFGTTDSRGDHRTAMIAAVAGCAGAGCEILGAECVSVSYPRFFEEVTGV